MKYIVYLLNLAWVGFVIFILLKEGWEALGILVLLPTPIITLFYLWLKPDVKERTGWLVLWLKRKKMEEQKKIDDLQSKI